MDPTVVTNTVTGDSNVTFASNGFVPPTGHFFAGWRINDTGTVYQPNDTYPVSGNSSVAAYAYWLPISYTVSLSVNPSGAGTVSGAGTYNYGTSATITTTPDADHTFLRWSDDVTDASRTFTVTGDVSLTAYFVLTHPAVTLSVNGHGSVSGAGTYDYRDTVTITATPDEHYHFVNWSDGNTNASRTFTITDNVVLTAYFSIDTFSVLVNVDSTKGTVEQTVNGVIGNGVYDYGTQVTLTPRPKENVKYHFQKWSDEDTDNPRVVTVTEDISLGAIFALNQYTITVSVSPPDTGTVSGAGTYDYNSIVTLTATPANGYHFVNWSDGNTNVTRSVKVKDNIALTASFSLGMDKNLGSTVILTANDFGEEKIVHFSVFKEERNYIKYFSTILTGYTDSASTGLMTTPIVTYTAENAFTFDISPGDTISLQFTRTNPQGMATYITEGAGGEEIALPWDLMGDDRMWSNRVWKNNLMSLINRWQAETNGCVMRYIPLDPMTQYDVAYNVFIKSVEFDNNITSPEILKGTVELQVGSMTGDAKIDDDSATNIESEFFKAVPYKEMSITMSNSNGTADYVLFDKGNYHEYEQYINFTKKEDYIGFYVLSGTTYKFITASNCKDDNLITIDQIDLSNQTKAYFLNNINCISKYTLKGGPEQPFPLLTMEISKRRLSAVAPDLLNDIYAGFNTVTINAMGSDRFVVTKCSSSSTTYKITAYSIFEAFRSAKLSTAIYFGASSTTQKPYDIISMILATNYNATYGKSSEPVHCIAGEGGNIRYAYRKSYNNNAFVSYLFHSESVSPSSCTFNTNTSAWYVVSLCAAMINCKIWFSNNNVYIVDTSITYEELKNPTDDIASNLMDNDEVMYVSRIYLNTDDPYPLSITNEEKQFTKSLCDEILLGDEGAETVVNSVLVEFDASKDPASANDGAKSAKQNAIALLPGQVRTGNKYTNSTWSTDFTPVKLAMVKKSQDMYGVKEETVSIDEFGYVQAQNLADVMAAAYCDSEQSIGFTLKETHFEDETAKEGKYWRRYFPEVTYADMIVDYSHDLMLTTKSNYTKDDGSRYMMPNKLVLSTYTHNFPEGTTEYWFGIIKPTDITQNTKEISATVYKR